MRSVRNTHRTAMKRMPFAWKSCSSAAQNEERKPSPTEAERLLIVLVDSHNMDILTDRRSVMYIVKAEAKQIENIVNMSIRAFETDVDVGGAKGDCPPEFDSIEWHKQMVWEGHLYQAMIGEDLVGAAIVFPDETEKNVYIGRIFIDSVYHRKGYGIRLMDCIEKNFPWATEFNLDTPYWNERTNAFYKRLGYRIIKVEDGFIFYQKRKSEPNTIQNFT